MEQNKSSVSREMSLKYDFGDVTHIQKLHGDEIVGKYDNVISTGVGLKMVDGQPTGEKALILFVREKVHRDGLVKLSLDQIAPERIGGVAVDVIEVGDIVKHTGFTRRTRPILPGYSVSQGNVTAGTIGGIFVDNDGDVVVLSNNHVLADENRAKLGDPIYQPGIADMPAGFDLQFSGFRGPVQNLPYFATLKRFIKLVGGGETNKHDSAIAKVAKEIIDINMLSANYPNGLPLTGTATATPGMDVQKFGRTTGKTQGKVLAVGAPFTVGYDMGPVKFDDCIVCTSLSNGGDSGSCLLDLNMNVVGLLFAGSDKVTIFHPIRTVMDEYGLKLWTQNQNEKTTEFWGKTWKQVFRNDAITLNPKGVLIVDEAANYHAFVDSVLTAPVVSVSVDVFTGSDQGVTWGPGIAVVYPGGVLNLNVRYNQGFSLSWNGQEFISKAQSSEPNRWYTLQMRLGKDWVVGEVVDKTAMSTRWTKIAELPTSNIGGAPLSIRLGKMDTRGSSSDAESDPGPEGRCQFANLTIV